MYKLTKSNLHGRRVFDIRFLKFLLQIKPAVAFASGWADT